MLLLHREGGVKQSQYISGALRGNGILDDIRAEFLHLTEMIYNPLLRRSGSKVMEGTDNMHPCFMRRVSYRLHGIFASGQFHVN